MTCSAEQHSQASAHCCCSTPPGVTLYCEEALAVGLSFGPPAVGLFGIGIADQLNVTAQGEETALEHGSGLGLWLLQWRMARLGISVRFETGFEGSTAVLSFPPTTVAGADTSAEIQPLAADGEN